MQQKKNNLNFVLFLVLAMLILSTGPVVQNLLWPPKPPEPPKPEARPSDPAAVTNLVGALARTPGTPGLGGVCGQLGDLAIAANWPEVQALARKSAKPKVLAEKKPADKQEPPKPTKPPIAIGGEGFFLTVQLDHKGGGVRGVVLNDFQAATAMGRPAWEPGAAGKKVPEPEQLVPEAANVRLPSNLLYHYAAADLDKPDARPLVTLGEEQWEMTEEARTPDEHRISFAAKVGDVTLTKTYTLRPGDYHIGLQVKMEAARDVKFKYQLASAHGLPIEGKWYTYTFRNAVVGRVNAAGYFQRALQDQYFIQHRGGGDPVLSADGKGIRYAGVAIQYFASVVVVDDEQPNLDFIARARPTVVSAPLKGRIKNIDLERSTFEIVGDDRLTYKFVLAPELKKANALAGFVENVTVRLVYHTDPNDRLVVTRFYTLDGVEDLLWDDINVRLMTQTFDVKAGEPVTHKYLLYNGPAKVGLLGQLKGARKVDPALIDRYVNTLHLNTITDSPSPGWWGDYVWGPSHISDLIILIINVMHNVLYWLNQVVPVWGLNVVMLTVLVRGLMFPFSRKQAQMSIKMQQLAPLLKELQKKHGDDKQAMAMEQMALYRKHNINPLGSCWIMLLQMPVFVGLYYALQESILFRLAEFLWIDNLAAPDMLIYWTQAIPMISQPADYGGMLYLGPYFNLLPGLAIALMIVQQKLMTPPATNEEQEMQQKMMMYIMMPMICLMFYKVAAGLCIYFIASSLWGFAERQLLPKKKPADAAPTAAEPKPTFFQKTMERLEAFRGARPDAAENPTPSTPAGPLGGAAKRRKDKKKRKGSRREPAPDAGTPRADRDDETRANGDGIWGKVQRWWKDLLRKAEKR